MEKTILALILGATLSCAPSPDASSGQISSEFLAALDAALWADPAAAAEALARCLESAAGRYGEGETEAAVCREVYAARMAGDTDLATCLTAIRSSSLDEDPAVMAESCRANPGAENQRRDYAECVSDAGEQRFDELSTLDYGARGPTPEEEAERRALCDEARAWRLRADSIHRTDSPSDPS